jgi:hypothetical protein
VRALAELTPQYLDFFSRAAVKYNVNVIGGTQFTLEAERLFNVAYLFRRDGTIERQEKLHVTPDERRWWGVEPGSRLGVFETDRGKIAILPSYDVMFPELARIAVGEGAQILFVPFSVEDRAGYLRVRYCCAPVRREAPAPAAEVVDHVRGIARAGAGHGHRRVRDHELEHELRPGVRVELGGPLRQRAVADPLPHPAAAEGQVDQHADPAVLREREDHAPRPRGCRPRSRCR